MVGILWKQNVFNIFSVTEENFKYVQYSLGCQNFNIK